jgi:uncharacterized protein YuzE
MMKAYWDPEADAVSFDLSRGKAVGGEEVARGIIFHYDKNDKIVEIEFLNFSKRFDNLVFPKLDEQSPKSASARTGKGRRRFRLVLAAK